MARLPCLFLAILAPFAWALPACDAPEVRTRLISMWNHMAKNKGGELIGSSAKVWNLRQEGKAGECRADFLATSKSSRIGGSIPFKTSMDAAGHLKLQDRGEPTFNLLQSDSLTSR